MSDLSFRPFSMMTTDEIAREQLHWKRVIQSSKTAVQQVAIRHMRRCAETIRERTQ